MKAILIVLKTLVITYWALAATLFTSMLFFPSAIDTLYSGYTQFVEIIEVEEEPTCLALIPECGYYGEVETEEPVVEEESSEPVTEESEEPIIEDESSEPVTTEEETTEPSETEEESSEESSEPETTSDGEAAEVDPSSEEPTTSEEETTEPSEEEEEVVIDEETPVDPIPEEEVTEPIIVDFIPLTEEEFVNLLETILIYSAVSMLPITLFVFSLGKKHRDLSSPTKPEIQKPAVVTDASGKVKKSAKVKYESIGLTGLKIKK
jgi:hypothetical protein